MVAQDTALSMTDTIYKIFMMVTERDMYLILAICCLCALMLREILGSTLVAVVVIPFFAASSIVLLYVFRDFKILVEAGDDNQLVAATGLGVTIAFIVLAIFFDLILGVTDWRVRRMVKGRNLGKS